MIPQHISQDSSPRNRIIQIIEGITPLDALEQEHITDTLNWIVSGAPIFRVQKPDVPNKHLVSYFVMLDEAAGKILLVDHIKSGLWLPCGGHVEVDEDPRETALRECWEELGVSAEFWRESPLFITSTVTVGMTAGHTDVSLWYVMKDDHRTHYTFDPGEFKSIRWYDFDTIPYASSDPHMKRFMEKLCREV